MNRKTAKLIRGFCKLTNKPYREFKRAYSSMNQSDQHKTKVSLKNFWDENEALGLLNHKKYYDLKRPLTRDAAYTASLREAARKTATQTND